MSCNYLEVNIHNLNYKEQPIYVAWKIKRPLLRE
jgi:hypothetical protein